MPVPTRLGLVTLHALCRKVIQIITKFQDKMQEFLTSEEYGKIVALLECARAVFDDVPQYPTE